MWFHNYEKLINQLSDNKFVKKDYLNLMFIGPCIIAIVDE